MSASEDIPAELTQEEAARRIGITTRQLRRIPDEYTGRLENGRYPWPEVRNGYRRWLKNAGRRESERVSDEKRERARKLELQNRRLELELAELEGRLVPVEVVERRFAAFAEEVKNALRAAAARWAPYLCHERPVAEAQAELSRLINDLLTELADGKRDAAD